MIRFYEPPDRETLLEVWFLASAFAHPLLDPDFLESERIAIPKARSGSSSGSKRGTENAGHAQAETIPLRAQARRRSPMCCLALPPVLTALQNHTVIRQYYIH